MKLQHRHVAGRAVLPGGHLWQGGFFYVQVVERDLRNYNHSPYFDAMRASTYGRQSSNKEKSIGEQLEAGHLVIDEQGWTNAGDYQDGRSASRFGTKVRGGWTEVTASVEHRALDVLILWESSRGDRTPETWLAFLGRCREHSVRIYVVTHDRLYDMKNARDWKTLAEDGISNAYESELLSVRTRRGHAGAAKKGLPPGGPTPYGYKRTFDPETGKREGQFISEPEASHVRQMFRWLSQNVPVLQVADRLNALQKDGDPWTRARVRRLAHNRAYVALRAHKGAEHKGNWEAVVDTKLFYSVQQVLNDPRRKITRPGRQLHLLTYLARCAVCGGWIYHAKDKYKCLKGCVSGDKRYFDQAVTQVILARLKEPDALEALTKDDDEHTHELDGRIAAKKAKLDEWRQKALMDLVTIETLNMAETQLTEEIKQLQKQAKQLRVPPALRNLLDGPIDEIEERWNSATLTARRAVIASLCEIRVATGMPGRTSNIQKQVRAFHRLRASRWHGDDHTWGDYWV